MVLQNLLVDKLKFKLAKNKIISYTDMSFDSIRNSMILEIVISPKAKIDDKDLRLLLIVNGYDISKIKIRKSEVAYQ